MQITGIIAEYNPFHNGHAYQLSQAREQTHADYIVVILTGCDGSCPGCGCRI